jgi:hypothetical protein
VKHWAALIAVVALCGCNSGSLEGGRYKCVYNGQLQDEQQCPGDWRCGLEGYCHHYNDTSVKWRCLSAADCELKWSCGLDESRDAGQCHDPDPLNVQPWACNDDSHCTAGWHCGPGHVCYDRTVAAPADCRPDRGDCADGWRCGLTGKCQDTVHPGPSPCATDAGLDDSWCDQQWRCAPAGSCIDPASDALVPGALPALDAGERINPFSEVTPVDHFAFSPLYEGNPGRGVQTEVFLQGGRARAILSDRTGGTFAHLYDLGSAAGILAVAAQGSRSMHIGASEAFYIPDETSRVFFALVDGGVRMSELYPDGMSTTPAELYTYDGPIQRLTVGSTVGTLAPVVMGFSEHEDVYVTIVGNDAYPSVFVNEFFGSFIGSGPPGNRIVDAVGVRASEVTYCDFTVDGRGLWTRPHNVDPAGGGYEHIAVQVPPFINDTCYDLPNAQSQRITGLAPLGRDWLGVSSTNFDGGGSFVSVLDLRGLWTGADETVWCHTNLDECDDPLPVQIDFGPCAACPQRLLDFAITADELGKPLIEARCGAEDGGTTGYFKFSQRPGTASCISSLSDGANGPFGRTRILAADHHTPGQVAWGGVDGFTWAGRTATSASAMIFDRAPTTVARFGPGLDESRLFTSEITGTPVAGLGYAVALISGVLVGVDREPTWLITDNHELVDISGVSQVSQGHLLGLVGTSVTPLSDPLQAVSARYNGGGHAIVIAAGGTIFAGDMEPVLKNQLSYAQIGLRVVAPAQLESIAFPEVSPAGVFLQGYAVTPIGVLRVTADTLSRWTFAEVSLPSDKAPLEVWFEKNRGRVGFTDGRVYSLPSRVEIAPAVPGSEAIDYAQSCNQQFVLASGGVFRLEAVPDKAIGVWKPVELPSSFATGGFAHGRLHGVGGDLYVFSGTGEGAKVKVADACP